MVFLCGRRDIPGVLLDRRRWYIVRSLLLGLSWSNLPFSREKWLEKRLWGARGRRFFVGLLWRAFVRSGKLRRLQRRAELEEAVPTSVCYCGCGGDAVVGLLFEIACCLLPLIPCVLILFLSSPCVRE